MLGDFRVPTDIFPLMGYYTAATQRVVHELGFEHSFRQTIQKSFPSFQFITPAYRLDIDSKNELTHNELFRETESPAQSLDSLNQADLISEKLCPIIERQPVFPPSSLINKRKCAAQLQAIIEDATHWSDKIQDTSLTHTLLALPSVFGANLSTEQLRPTTVARNFSLWRQGASRLDENLDTLYKIFTEKLKSHSGEIRELKLDSFRTKFGKVVGLRLLDGEEIGAKHIISTLAADECSGYFKRPSRYLRKRSSQLVKKGFRYTLNFIIKNEGIPAAMANTAFLVDDPKKPLCGTNAIALFLNRKNRDYGILTAQCIAPVICQENTNGTDDPEEEVFGDDFDATMAEMRVHLRKTIEKHIPFMSNHLLTLHSPNEATPPEGDFRIRGLKEPMRPQSIWSLNDPKTKGISGIGYRSGTRGLTLASSQIIPSFGTERTFIIAYGAAAIACSKVKKRSRNKMLPASS